MKNKKNTTYKIGFWVAVVFLVLVELAFSRLAYHTLGEVASAVYFFLVAVNIIPIALIIFNQKRQLLRSLAIGTMLTIGLLIIPYQVYLGNRLILLKNEGLSIVSHLQEKQAEEGIYPQNIDEYKFTNAKLEKHFDYIKKSDSKFDLYYYVGTKGTSHFYFSKNGKWGYYPD